MATRSQELAPNRRTCAGKPPPSLSGADSTRPGGTQTTCMSEWTSIPAALALRMVKAGACSRGGRDDVGRGFASLALPGERLRWLMASATLGRVGATTAGVGQE